MRADYQGFSYQTLKRFQEAINDLSKVIKLDPESTTGYFWRSVNHHLLKNVKSALSDLEQNLKIDPDDAEAKLAKGGILIESGETEVGIREIKRVCKQFPDEPGPSFFLYWAYKKTDQPDKAKQAIEHFRKVKGDEQDEKAHLEELGFVFG
ncbi:MAG TPA: tetratricopeptide repeat protein [Gemmataceae bacterium]|nr:tetratricopeptide repeat protein [Gemmataceae bacterium]